MAYGTKRETESISWASSGELSGRSFAGLTVIVAVPAKQINEPSFFKLPRRFRSVGKVRAMGFAPGIAPRRPVLRQGWNLGEEFRARSIMSKDVLKPHVPARRADVVDCVVCRWG